MNDFNYEDNEDKLRNKGDPQEDANPNNEDDPKNEGSLKELWKWIQNS